MFRKLRTLSCMLIGTVCCLCLMAFYSCFLACHSNRYMKTVQEMCIPPDNMRLHSDASNITIVMASASLICDKDVGEMRLYRDLRYLDKKDISSDLFPYLNQGDGAKARQIIQQPGETPNTAHFVWCGHKMYRFEDHLGVVSILKVLVPQKLVFHYDKLPMEDNSYYNTWFLELRQSVPHLILRKTNTSLLCNTTKPLMFGLEQLVVSNSGGIFFGARTILLRIPDSIKTQSIASFFTSGQETNNSRGFVISSKRGIKTMDMSLSTFENNAMKGTEKCVTMKEFNDIVGTRAPISPSDIPPCILVTDTIFPKDIMYSSTPFATVARWLYYGKSDKFQASKSKDNSDLVPMISHYISLKNINATGPVNWSFGAYVSVLSALYIGGFERVYVHGDEEPVGIWWDKLKTENVTFVQVDAVETVFQQHVEVEAHLADIHRILILLKYGGFYQDWNVVWVNRVSDDLRRYEAVFSMGWVIWPEWPETISNGMFLSKPESQFLKLTAKSLSHYQDNRWALNSMWFPYKIYERNPEILYIHKQLQVVVFYNISHPVWEEGYRRTLHDRRPTMNFDLAEISGFHFTVPKFHPSMSSYAAIKNGTDLYANLGRRIFAVSGRTSELNNG